MTSFTLYSMSIVENCRCAWIFAVLFLALSGRPVQADDWRPLVQEEILQRWSAISPGSQNNDVSFPTLSDSYGFGDCDSKPEVSLIRALQPGRNGVELKCASPFWSQTLAIDLAVYEAVLVLNSDVRYDQPVIPDQVSLVEMNIADMTQGYLLHPDDVKGMIARRSLRAGTPLTPDMLEPEDIIDRGQPVTIRLNRPGIQVEIKGTALAAGHLGERIRIRNTHTERTLYAEIIGDGIVQVR